MAIVVHGVWPAPLLAAILSTPAPGSAWPSDAIAVAMPTDVAPVALFADERERIRERIARSLFARGHRVVPVVELVALEEAARTGTLTPEGVTCRAPLRPVEIEHRYLREQTIARVDANCSDTDCHLQVTFDRADDQPAPTVVYRSSRVHTPERANAWIAAAADLRESETSHAWGSSIGWSHHSSALRFDSPSGIGPWSAEVPSAPFDTAEDKSSACASADPFLRVDHEVRAAIDPSGRVRRCEASSASIGARSGDASCVCGLVEGLRFERGRAGRRLRVDVEDAADVPGRPHPAFDARWTATQPDTDDWIDRLRASAVLERCRQVAMPRHTTATVTLALRDDGTIDDVTIAGAGRAPQTIDYLACVADGLKTIALPCRPPGVRELVASIAVDTVPIDSVPLPRP